MRTLAEIVADVENGGIPDSEELRYALLALHHLSTFDGMALLRAAEGTATDHVLAFQEHALRVRGARATSPKQWLGWGSDPDNPEYQVRRREAAEVLRRTLH